MDQPYFLEKQMRVPLGINNSQITSSVLKEFVPPSIKRPMPFHNVNIQPSNACPRNFVIFDQTHNQSHIMFHPEISSKLFSHTFGAAPSLFHDINVSPNNDNANGGRETESLLEEEDSDDIDLLLSSEYEDDDESEDDEVSTARTGAYYECGSPDSCSNYEPSPKKRRSVFEESAEIEDKKHKRMKKMVEALRGMVPGANQMSTVSVLDESVRYLKSLREEVQQLGISSFGG